MTLVTQHQLQLFDLITLLVHRHDLQEIRLEAVTTAFTDGFTVVGSVMLSQRVLPYPKGHARESSGRLVRIR